MKSPEKIKSVRLVSGAWLCLEDKVGELQVTFSLPKKNGPLKPKMF
jgi:hypothetical protein